MAEWLYEAGIGENRAALVEGATIIEACIEIIGNGLQCGAIVKGRLRDRNIFESGDGAEALLDGVPRGLTIGTAVTVMITRDALPEPGKTKRAKARIVSDVTPIRSAPSLSERIISSGLRVTALLPNDDDHLERVGWSETIAAGQSGTVPFGGGALQIHLTSAMTLIDVDGTLDPATLGIAGAVAAAQAIRRYGIAGSIGIDFPTTDSKAKRSAIAAALDLHMPTPFERTSVNGFGFLQIIRPRHRTSILEVLAADPAAHAARALIRAAQRSRMTGSVVLVAAPAVVRTIGDHPDWCSALGAQLGGTVTTVEDAKLAVHSGYVAAQ